MMKMCILYNYISYVDINMWSMRMHDCLCECVCVCVCVP